MSRIYMANDRIVQAVGENASELGHIAHDRHTGEYVLWIKDHKGDISGSPGGYVRGGEWASP